MDVAFENYRRRLELKIRWMKVLEKLEAQRMLREVEKDRDCELKHKASIATAENPFAERPLTPEEWNEKLARERCARDFNYHSVNPAQAQKMAALRTALRNIAEQAHSLCPESRERSLALTKLEEAMFWFNASIARP